MEGEDRIRLLNKPEDGDYVITVGPTSPDQVIISAESGKMPNTYARGILFGKMTLELADLSNINCQGTDYHCDVDFKAKVDSSAVGAPQSVLIFLRAGSRAVTMLSMVTSKDLARPKSARFPVTGQTRWSSPTRRLARRKSSSIQPRRRWCPRAYYQNRSRKITNRAGD